MADWTKAGKWDNVDVSGSGRVTSKVGSLLNSDKGAALLNDVARIREAHTTRNLPPVAGPVREEMKARR
jgi:hypothetical protein